MGISMIRMMKVDLIELLRRWLNKLIEIMIGLFVMRNFYRLLLVLLDRNGLKISLKRRQNWSNGASYLVQWRLYGCQRVY